MLPSIRKTSSCIVRTPAIATELHEKPRYQKTQQYRKTRWRLWRNLEQDPFLTDIELHGVSNVGMYSWPLARLHALTLSNCNDFYSTIPNLGHVFMRYCFSPTAVHWDSLGSAEFKNYRYELYYPRLFRPDCESLTFEASWGTAIASNHFVCLVKIT